MRIFGVIFKHCDCCLSESLILLLMPFFLGNFPESLNSVDFLQVNCITLQCTSQIAGELRGGELQISGY